MQGAGGKYIINYQLSISNCESKDRSMVRLVCQLRCQIVDTIQVIEMFESMCVLIEFLAGKKYCTGARLRVSCEPR